MYIRNARGGFSACNGGFIIVVETHSQRGHHDSRDF